MRKEISLGFKIIILCIMGCFCTIGCRMVQEDYREDIKMPELIGQRSKIRENYPIKNVIREAKSDYLQMTFSLIEVEGGLIPYQNGIVVPDFMSQERQGISLNGVWNKKRFESDYNFTLKPRSIDWIKEAEAEARGAHLLTFDDSMWDAKSLPQPENELTGLESVEGAETYEDGVWYRREFEMDETYMYKEVFLKCLSISYICDIWINGHWIGYHEGGFTPFAFNISPYIQFGEPNVIFIRIDNPPWGSRLDTIPAIAGTDYFNYTGIIQDIFIEVTERVMIARADFVTKDLSGDVAVKVVVSNYENESKTVIVKREIYKAEQSRYKDSPSIANLIGESDALITLAPIEIELDGNEDQLLNYNFSIPNPKIWDVLEPNLYVSRISILDENGVVMDTLYTQFGIRTIHTEGTKIMLNNSNYFARGIARHEEWPGYGRTATWERIMSDMDQIVEMGVNFIRTGHYPNHVHTYLYLDRLGIPSMSEVPLWQLRAIHFKVLEEKGLALQMFREMVFSQYNSPSVILWSTQNECRGTLERKAYNERLVNDIRTKYDDSRLITQSAAADQGGPRDASMEPLDVNGWTMYFGIFHGSTAYNGTKQFLNSVRDYWNKPILNTEFGVWSGESVSGAYEQAKHYKATFDALMEFATVTPQGYFNENGMLAGVSYWIMYDWYVNHNKWIATLGIFHMDREKMKPVGNEIISNYTMLKDRESNNDFMPKNQRFNIISDSSTHRGKISKLNIATEVDYSEYSYFNVICTFSKRNEKVNISIKDKDGNEWGYYTDSLSKNKLNHIVIPIYRMYGIDMLAITNMTIKYLNEQEAVIEEIYLTK